MRFSTKESDVHQAKVEHNYRMIKQINSIAALEARIGMTPGPRDLKVIDFLDAHAISWISQSPCMFISLASKDSQRVRVLISGGPAGYVETEPMKLHIPLDAVDHPEWIAVGDGWGSLFIIPSQRESLRVNGTVSSVSSKFVTIEISECYLHCAKAFMRSRLWEEYTNQQSPIASEAEFCTQARFMLVATSDYRLNADLSPKGDPAGKLLCLENGFAWYPDRPGNRRVDGFRNILSKPEIELVGLIAGSSQILRITGTAMLFSDHPMKDFFEVEKKAPHVMAKIQIESMALEDSPTLKKANLWPPQALPVNFKATEIWKDHMNLSKVKGIDATLAKAAVSLPGVIEKGIDWDYKNNLY
jgi:predicted pyridoxine 5'-phosphate oxidase superfamily flavin-nucleotide-binding protein